MGIKFCRKVGVKMVENFCKKMGFFCTNFQGYFYVKNGVLLDKLDKCDRLSHSPIIYVPSMDCLETCLACLENGN